MTALPGPRTYNQNHVAAAAHGGPARQHLLDVELSLGSATGPGRRGQPFLDHDRGAQRRLACLRDAGVRRDQLSAGHRRHAGAVPPLHPGLPSGGRAGTGHPVAVFQRIDQAGYKLPIDERILADTDTLMVFGLDHLLSEQEAEPEEIEAIREWLDREGTCLLLAPHHDVGFTDDFAAAPGRVRAPRRPPGATPTALRPVHPLADEGARRAGAQHVGASARRRRGDRSRSRRSPDCATSTRHVCSIDVTTFNFHPHLPHYELTAPEGDELSRPRATASRPATGRTRSPPRATREFNALDLDAAVRSTRRRHRPHRLDSLHHAVRWHRQPAQSVAQPGDHEVTTRGTEDAVLRPPDRGWLRSPWFTSQRSKSTDNRTERCILVRRFPLHARARRREEYGNSTLKDNKPSGTATTLSRSKCAWMLPRHVKRPNPSSTTPPKRSPAQSEPGIR